VHRISGLCYGFRTYKSYVFRISISTGTIEISNVHREFYLEMEVASTALFMWSGVVGVLGKSVVGTLNSVFLEDYFYKPYLRIWLLYLN
jgi:hypothetical protein